jgi:hypothetical protein
MKKIFTILTVLIFAAAILLSFVPASEARRGRNSARGPFYTDQNANGTCDRWEHRYEYEKGSKALDPQRGFQRDADGDGIPNGQDEDYVRPRDGTGYQGKERSGDTR